MIATRVTVKAAPKSEMHVYRWSVLHWLSKHTLVSRVTGYVRWVPQRQRLTEVVFQGDPEVVAQVVHDFTENVKLSYTTRPYNYSVIAVEETTTDPLLTAFHVVKTNDVHVTDSRQPHSAEEYGPRMKEAMRLLGTVVGDAAADAVGRILA